MYYVYTHIRNDLRVPFYVGKGIKKRTTEKNNRSVWWKNTANVSGFTVRILKEFKDEDEALRFERQIQLQYTAFGIELCNIAECGAVGSKGVKHTSERLAKISNASKRLWTNEEYAKMMRSNAKGLKNGFSDKRKYTLCHQDHGAVTLTQYEFRTNYGLSAAHLCDVLKGKRPRHKGWSLLK